MSLDVSLSLMSLLSLYRKVHSNAPYPSSVTDEYSTHTLSSAKLVSLPLSVSHPVAPVCCSSRYGLALLSSYGFFVVYSLRVNLSVAMVEMLNSTHQSNVNHSGSLCPAHPSPARPKHNHTVSESEYAHMMSYMK